MQADKCEFLCMCDYLCMYFTLLAYSSGLFCLPHCICMCHCTNNVVYIYPTFLHIYVKQQTATIIYHAPAKYKIPPSNATYVNYFICTQETTMSVYTSYELIAIKNVTRSTGIHTFHISGTCP